MAGNVMFQAPMRDLEDKDNVWNVFRSASWEAKYYHNCHSSVSTPAVWTRAMAIPEMHRHSIQRPDLVAKSEAYEAMRKREDEAAARSAKLEELHRINAQRSTLRKQKQARANLELRSGQPVHAAGSGGIVGPHPHLVAQLAATEAEEEEEVGVLRGAVGPAQKQLHKEKWNPEHLQPREVDAGDWRSVSGMAWGAKRIEERVRERWDEELQTLDKKDGVVMEIQSKFERQRRENRDRLRAIPTEYGHDKQGYVGPLTQAVGGRIASLAEPQQKYEVPHDLPPDHLDLNKLNHPGLSRQWSFSRPSTVKGKRHLLSNSASTGNLQLHAHAQHRAATAGGSASSKHHSRSLSSSKSSAQLGLSHVGSRRTNNTRRPLARPWGGGLGSWSGQDDAITSSQRLDSFDRAQTAAQSRRDPDAKPLYLTIADPRPKELRKPLYLLDRRLD